MLTFLNFKALKTLVSKVLGVLVFGIKNMQKHLYKLIKIIDQYSTGWYDSFIKWYENMIILFAYSKFKSKGVY